MREHNQCEFIKNDMLITNDIYNLMSLLRNKVRVWIISCNYFI